MRGEGEREREREMLTIFRHSRGHKVGELLINIKGVVLVTSSTHSNKPHPYNINYKACLSLFKMARLCCCRSNVSLFLAAMFLGLLMTVYTIRTIQLLGEEEVKEPVPAYNNRRLPRTELIEETSNNKNNDNNNNDNDNGGGTAESSSSPCNCKETGTTMGPSLGNNNNSVCVCCCLLFVYRVFASLLPLSLSVHSLYLSTSCLNDTCTSLCSW